MSAIRVFLILGCAGFLVQSYAADWSTDIEEVFPIRTVRVEHSGHPRGWGTLVSPILVVHRGTRGREAAATMFLGPGHGTDVFSRSDPN